MENLTGLAWLTGFPSGPPVLVRGAGDPLAGMHAAIAALLAVLARDCRGGGRLVEATMVEAALAAAAEQVIEFGQSKTVLERQGDRGPSAAPQGVHRCADPEGSIALAVEEDDQWDALARLIGRADLGADETLRHLDGRQARHDELDEVLETWARARTAEEAESNLLAEGVPASVVVAARDLVQNPQMRYRRLFEWEDHPVTGRHELPMLPFRFSRVPAWLRGPAPTLGQHDEEALREGGLSDEVIAALRDQGVLGERPQ